LILKVPVIIADYIDQNGKECKIHIYNEHFYRKTKMKKWIEKFTNNKQIILKRVTFGNYEISIETHKLFSSAVSYPFYQTETDKKRTEKFNNEQ
jgi:hypothetical protein